MLFGLYPKNSEIENPLYLTIYRPRLPPCPIAIYHGINIKSKEVVAIVFLMDYYGRIGAIEDVIANDIADQYLYQYQSYQDCKITFLFFVQDNPKDSIQRVTKLPKKEAKYDNKDISNKDAKMLAASISVSQNDIDRHKFGFLANKKD